MEEQKKTYTVADAEQLKAIYQKLAETCSEVIKLPVKDLRGREMDIIAMHLKSIAVSLELRGMKRLVAE